MKQNIVHYLKSLSARLLLLTFLWVSFISVLVGYTMLLNWQLEATSAATKTINNMRYHTFRAALFSEPQYSDVIFKTEVDSFNNSYQRLEKGDPWQPLMLPANDDIYRQLKAVGSTWFDDLLPTLQEAKTHGQGVNIQITDKLVTQLSALTVAVETDRGYYLWQLRYLQILLAFCDHVSLVALGYPPCGPARYSDSSNQLRELIRTCCPLWGRRNRRNRPRL